MDEIMQLLWSGLPVSDRYPTSHLLVTKPQELEVSPYSMFSLSQSLSNIPQHTAECVQLFLSSSSYYKASKNSASPVRGLANKSCQVLYIYLNIYVI
jgi:hypothetical protein